MTAPSRVEEIRRPFDQLARAVRQRTSGRQLNFMQNFGNYGDALIRYGTEVFLQDLGLQPRIFDMSRRSHKVAALTVAALDPYGVRNSFMYSGGGAWAKHCDVGLRNVARQMKACADVLVLPSTVEIMPMQRRPTIYRRDDRESCKTVPDAPFCHDMAFYLACVPRERWFTAASTISTRKHRGVFFRTDNESRLKGGSALPGNLDLSAQGTHRSDIQWFLAAIAACDEIVTDRLHVAIGGVLLGCKVWLAEGLTYKIRAIYETSIEPYFDNCVLVSDQEALRLASSSLAQPSAASAG